MDETNRYRRHIRFYSSRVRRRGEVFGRGPGLTVGAPGNASPASLGSGTDASPARFDPQHVSRLSAAATPHVC